MMNCLAIGLALSMHIGLQGEYNQAHPYATCETDKTIVGAYYNSEENLSLVGAYKFELGNDFILDAGVVTGYYHYPQVFNVKIKIQKCFRYAQ